ncbi:MAG: hypothetical protein ACOY40_09940 [Bacillota bacterium]
MSTNIGLFLTPQNRWCQALNFLTILGGMAVHQSRQFQRRPDSSAKGATPKTLHSALEKLLWSSDRTVDSTPPASEKLELGSD